MSHTDTVTHIHKHTITYTHDTHTYAYTYTRKRTQCNAQTKVDCTFRRSIFGLISRLIASLFDDAKLDVTGETGK